MAGVLPFFYTAAVEETLHRGNCTYINETEPLTFDLILQISFLANCHGEKVLLNIGTYVILIVVVVMFFQGWKWIQPVKKWIPDALIVLTLGIIIGIINRWDPANISDSVQWQEKLHDQRLLSLGILKFFALPMIILNAAYDLHNVNIFRQLDDIILLAILGTLINVGGTVLCLKGINYATNLPHKPSYQGERYWSERTLYNYDVSWSQFLVFATTLGAVDHVTLFPAFTDINVDIANTPFFYLLWGETSLSIGFTYTMFSGLLKILNYYQEMNYGVDKEFPTDSMLFVLLSFATGPILAALTAVVMVCLSSGMSKLAGDRTHGFLPYIVTGFVWLGYYIVERMGFSSIFYVIFCAVLQARYTFPNISCSNIRIIKGMIRTNATVIEIALFGFIGHEFATEIDINTLGYAFVVLLILTFLRAVSVFSLFRFVNYGRSKREQFGMKWQATVLLRGVRGSLTLVMALEAYSSKRHPQYKVFMTTLLATVFLTILIYGIIAKAAVKNLEIKRESPKAEDFTEVITLISSSAGEAMREVIIGSGLISGNSQNPVLSFMTALDNRFKKLLLKDTDSRNMQNTNDFEDEVNEAYNWLRENPKETESDPKEGKKKKEHDDLSQILVV